MKKKKKNIFNRKNLIKLCSGEITKSLVFTTEGKDYFLECDTPDSEEIDEIVGGRYEICAHIEAKLSIISVYVNVNAIIEKLDENSLYYENFGCKLFGNVVFVVGY